MTDDDRPGRICVIAPNMKWAHYWLNQLDINPRDRNLYFFTDERAAQGGHGFRALPQDRLLICASTQQFFDEWPSPPPIERTLPDGKTKVTEYPPHPYMVILNIMRSVGFTQYEREDGRVTDL